MKKLKYIIIPIAAVFNSFMSLMILFSRDILGGKFALNFYIPVVIVSVLLDVALTVASVKVAADCISKVKRKPLFLVAFGFVSVVGSIVSLAVLDLWLFVPVWSLAFVSVCFFWGTLYAVLSPTADAHGRLFTVISVAVGGTLCLLMPFVFVASIGLMKTGRFSLMGLYTAGAPISALFFLFGVTLLTGAFVKKQQLSWTRPVATILLAVLVVCSIPVVGFTGLETKNTNPIKNIAVDVGAMRLGLTDADYVCAYKGIDGEAIYVFRSERTGTGAEFDELLEYTFRNGPHTFDGAEYERVCVERFVGHYVFTLIPA